MKLTPKKWEDFQHYKDRSPAWIKLHKALLDDFAFASLPVESRALAPMLWLLASETDNGVFDATLERLAFRLRHSTQEIAEALHPLIESGFFVEVEGDGPEREKWPSRYVSDKLKASILERDGHQCVACGGTLDLEIDHKVPVSKGGESVEENLQTLCRPCNRSKRVKTPEQFATQEKTVRSLEKRREQVKEEKNIGAVANATRPKDVENKFEEFWKVYPRRKGDNPKAPARKSFFALVKQGVDPDAIIRGVTRAVEKNRDKIGTEFIPQTIKWLRDRRWEDYTDNPEPVAGFVLSLKTPEQARLWLEAKSAAGENTAFMKAQLERGGSITVPSEYPPGHERAA